MVYHDADKEFLLTYFPPELGMPVNDQERLIGPLINQVVNRLPPEKRKAYLLRPQSFLTLQSLMERILQADGITSEMLDAQQKRLNVLQRLLQASSPEVRSEIIKQDSALIDEAFFTMLGQLFEAAMASNQQQTAQALSGLQQQLLAETEFGRRLQVQVQEVEAAVKTLQEVGQGLTREKLVDILIDAPSDERRKALVGLTRGGLDYSFFQAFSERIDRAPASEKPGLEAMRAHILEYIDEIDRALELQFKEAQAFLDKLLSQPDIGKATEQSLSEFNEVTVQALNQRIRDAQQNKANAAMSKLQQVVEVLQKASAPPELELIEDLLQHEPAEFDRVLAEHDAQLTPQFMDVLGNLSTQLESQPASAGNPEDKMMVERVQMLYRAALKYSMKKNL
jgi:hypothetical protein